MLKVILISLALASPAWAHEAPPAKCVEALRKMQPVAEPMDTTVLWNELSHHSERLLDTTPDNPAKGYIVFLGRGQKLPQTVLELGRLREEAFREVGEGTGRDRDNDEFDSPYEHLVAWDKKLNVITGAYRLGRVDELLHIKGPQSLYTSTLFEFSDLLNKEFRLHTIEVGRSFVSPKFQKGVTLPLLFSAIAKFLVLNPSYKNLMGPVSLSADLKEDSKVLITRYLMQAYSHERARAVTALTPPVFHPTHPDVWFEARLSQIQTLEDLQAAVAEIQEDPKFKLPPLIKIYLDLRVRFLSFNWDQSFNSVDGLIWTDISELPQSVHERYMGVEGAALYRAAQLRVPSTEIK